MRDFSIWLQGGKLVTAYDKPAAPAGQTTEI